MSSFFNFDPPPRKSKQQASKSISEQSRKRAISSDEVSEPATIFPSSVYGELEQPVDFLKPEIVLHRELIANSLLKTVSNMYFGTTDPFAEILRCLDDRIDRTSRRYVSGLETLLRNEVNEVQGPKNKSTKEKIIITPLDMLACPFREPEVIDHWTPYDVALFQLGVYEMRGFNVKKLTPLFDGRKSVEELTKFFDRVYSKSDNWKRFQRLLNDEPISEDDESMKSGSDSSGGSDSESHASVQPP